MNDKELGSGLKGYIQKIINDQTLSKEKKRELLTELLRIFATRHTYSENINALEEKFWIMVLKESNHDTELIPDISKIASIPWNIQFNRYAIYSYPSPADNRPFYGTLIMKFLEQHKEEIKKRLDSASEKEFMEFLSKLIINSYYNTYRGFPPRDVVENTVKELISFIKS